MHLALDPTHSREERIGDYHRLLGIGLREGRVDEVKRGLAVARCGSSNVTPPFLPLPNC